LSGSSGPGFDENPVRIILVAVTQRISRLFVD
jgi:hypothetical protein